MRACCIHYTVDLQKVPFADGLVTGWEEDDHQGQDVLVSFPVTVKLVRGNSWRTEVYHSPQSGYSVSDETTDWILILKIQT